MIPSTEMTGERKGEICQDTASLKNWHNELAKLICHF